MQKKKIPSILKPKTKKPESQKVDLAPATESQKRKVVKKKVAKEKVEKNRINIFLSKPIYSKMKIRAIELEMTGSEYVESLIRKDCQR